MRTALVIMAAGIGSRFSGGIKQLTPVGPHNELIIDYSIFDALEAGFNEVVFIIRRDLLEEVRAMIGDRLEAMIGKVPNLQKVSYVYQEITALPDGVDAETLVRDRKKPWGTGQAVLACRGEVDCPFAIINADDYYGKTAFRQLHEFLLTHEGEKGSYCLSGFVLKNTLSPYGGVTRGLCTVDAASYLSDIAETRGLIPTEQGAETDGRYVDPETLVSMNIWGFQPDFLEGLDADFREFLQTADVTADEFLLPEVVGKRVLSGQAKVLCLRTEDRWFGVTYQEDKPIVIGEIRKLIDAGLYAEDLWSELL